MKFKYIQKIVYNGLLSIRIYHFIKFTSEKYNKLQFINTKYDEYIIQGQKL